jgi:NADPH:quinone reductase-like Zn-dependent oxidoreductase
MVGGDYVPRNIASAAVDGRIVNIAFLKGAKVNIDMMPVMLKRLSLTGSTLRPRSPAYKALIADQLRESIWPLIEAKRIVPTLALCLPWQRIAEAHDAMENNALLGKAVLEVSP